MADVNRWLAHLLRADQAGGRYNRPTASQIHQAKLPTPDSKVGYGTLQLCQCLLHNLGRYNYFRQGGCVIRGVYLGLSAGWFVSSIAQKVIRGFG